MRLFEGGNVVVKDKDGNKIPAQRIPIKDIGRGKFIKETKQLIEELNTLYTKKYKEPLWPNLSALIKGSILFNGSTSFIMDEEIPDEEILPHKPDSGDIDLIVPEDKKDNLWELLNTLLGKKITKDYSFINHNKETLSKVNDQINALFKYLGKYFVQIDFEFLPFETQTIDYSGNTMVAPSTWAKFGHSSSLKDTVAGLKGVSHKYLLRSISYATSVKPNIIFVTPTANCENWKKKIRKKQNQNILKFSVSKGVRTAFKPLICNDRQLEEDGQFVFKEISTKDSEFSTDLTEIFEMFFNKTPTPQELNDLWSFSGLMDLMEKNLDKEQVKLAIERMFLLFWWNKDGKNIAQQIDRDSAAEDERVKMATINKLAEKFPVTKEIYKEWENQINDYYNNYGGEKNLFKQAVQNIS